MLVGLVYFSLFMGLCNADSQSSEEGGETICVPKDFKTIKEALVNAKKGDKVCVASGEYDENDGLSLKKGIEIYGLDTTATKITVGSFGMTLLGDNKIRNLTFNVKSGRIYLCRADNTAIQNCAITGNGVGSDGLLIEKSENVEIMNCTIANLRDGILFYYPPSRVLIKNSIISNNKRCGISISAQKEGSHLDAFGKPIEGIKQGGGKIEVELEYNDVWGSEYLYRGISAGARDISKDPKFVGENDYHLQPGSPCINAGDPDGKYNDTDGSRSDMGAFPYEVRKE